MSENEFSEDMGIEYLGVVDGATTLELELEQKKRLSPERPALSS